MIKLHPVEWAIVVVFALEAVAMMYLAARVGSGLGEGLALMKAIAAGQVQ